MKRFLYKIRHFYQLFIAFFPSELPQDVNELRAYALGICELYGFPSSDSYLHMIAAMIQHLDQNTYKISKRFFKIHIKNAIAKESAYWFMKEINQKKDESKKQTENGMVKSESVQLAGV